MTEHKATPEQRAAGRYDWALADTEARHGDPAFRCIMELRARVEALEAAAKPAESNHPEFPDGSLIDSVIACIDNGTACDREPARIARETVLEIAAWFDRLGYHSCAAELRKEVPQSC